MDLVGVASDIRSILIAKGGRLRLYELIAQFKITLGYTLSPESYGFNSVEELIRALDGVTLVKQGNELHVLVVQSNKFTKSSHLLQMVQVQQNSGRRRRGPFKSPVPPRFAPAPNRAQPKKYAHTQFIQKLPPKQPSPPPKQPPPKQPAPPPKSQSPPKQQSPPTTHQRRKVVVTKQDSLKTMNNRLKQTVQDVNGNNIRTSPIKVEDIPLPLSPPLSPTYQRFERTNDAPADLRRFINLYNLGEIDVQRVRVINIFVCKIKIGQNYTFTSYPKECSNSDEAEKICSEEALKDLIPRYERKSNKISSAKSILTRIPPMLEKHTRGIWAWQLEQDYRDEFDEMLPENWLQIVNASDCVLVDKITDHHILSYCQPGHKESSSRKMDNSSSTTMMVPDVVSVPANTVQLDENNKLFCQVTSVVSVNEIWCEQAGTDASNEFYLMFDRMQIYYQGHADQMVPSRILVGGYYIAKFGNEYYRVRVEKVENDMVDCFFIDIGVDDRIPKSDIFQLNRVYAKAQAQAFVCKLDGLDEYEDLSEKLTDLLDLCAKSVFLELVDTGDQNLIVLPVKMYDCTSGMYINETILDQAKSLRKKEMYKDKLDLNSLRQSNDLPSTGSLQCPYLPKIGDKQFMKVYVPMAVNPFNFFVQPSEFESELNEMMVKMQLVYKDSQFGNLSHSDVVPGNIYASKYKDGNWYRTSVIKVVNIGASVSAFYCDFGFYQTISLNQLVPLHKEFLELPYQALKAKLSGIKPKDTSWTVNDCQTFKRMIEKKRLYAQLTNIEKDFLYESDIVLKLQLIDTSADDDVIIGDELVRLGIAVPEM